MTEQIPPSRVVIHDDEVDEAVGRFADVLRSGVLTNGSETREFERSLEEFLPISHAVATNSGTSALEISLRALEIGNREVLVPTNTNFATGIAVLNSGATLRLYDSGLYPDIDSLFENVTDRTGAVVVVHIGGHITPAIGDIAEMCASKRISLIEDAAHAHASHLAGRRAGTFGDVAAFSFYETKALTTGEGGALVTDDERVAEAARSYRGQGFQTGTDLHVRHGNTWRMSELEAALGRILIRRLEDDSAHRTRLIRQYATLLSGESRLTFPHVPDGSGLSGHKCIAMLSDATWREPLRRAMLAAGIELDREVYAMPLHRQPIFREHVGSGAFPSGDSFADSHICLPMWRSMSPDVVDHVASVLGRELARLG